MDADEITSKIVTSDLFRKIGPIVFPAMHRAMAKVSGGKWVPGAGLILYTTGAKSGQRRETPLETIPRPDGSYLLVGSNFARESHPAWTHNLIAHPDAEILVRGETKSVTATLLEGDERELAWQDALAHWPSWSEYTNITDRTFRIFHLTPTT